MTFPIEDSFEFVTDAGETIVVNPRSQLTHVEKAVLPRIRPGKFREILKVDSSIPEWAEDFSYDTMQGSANWVPVNELTDEFVGSSAIFGKAGGALYELVSGYTYRKREMIRAKKLGINLDTLRAKLVLDKAESVLDWIAMNGTLDGTKLLRGLKGLYNQPGITPTVGTVTSTSYEDQFVTAGDDPVEIDGVIENMVEDLLEMEFAAETATKETGGIDTIVIPLTMKRLYTKAKSRNSSDSVMKLFKDRSTNVKKIVFNHKAETLGAGGVRRIVGLNGSDLEAARFILPKAPIPGEILRTAHGYHVPCDMVVGGFNTKMPQSLIYMDVEAAP